MRLHFAISTGVHFKESPGSASTIFCNLEQTSVILSRASAFGYQRGHDTGWMNKENELCCVSVGTCHYAPLTCDVETSFLVDEIILDSRTQSRPSGNIHGYCFDCETNKFNVDEASKNVQRGMLSGTNDLF